MNFYTEVCMALYRQHEPKYLRDKIAISAMNNLVSFAGDDSYIKEVCKISYKYADEMMLHGLEK